jgi:hypothetical protein
MRLIGPVACGLVLATGLLAVWGFAETLIGAMCALLGGNLLALALRKKDE